MTEANKWKIRAKFEKRDAWLGVFWDVCDTGYYWGVNIRRLSIYICVIPFFPIVITRERVVGVDGPEQTDGQGLGIPEAPDAA